jgi:hypothetical protein
LKGKSSLSPYRSRQKALRGLKAIIFAFCLLPFASSCGKVGAPVPPTRITERAREITLTQRGSQIIISWPAPHLVKQESSTSYIARVDIYRLAERREEAASADPDDFEYLAEVIGFLDRPALEEMARTGRARFADALDLTGKDLSEARLRYAVRYVNKRGQMAALSTTAAIEPVSAVSLPPGGVTVSDLAQSKVEIRWKAPEANVDGRRPAAIVGYNIYRRAARRDEFGEPINAEPVSGPSFEDTGFRYETEYVYVVRALSQGANGTVESADSEMVSFRPVDKFAPEAPDPVSVASANGTISLFWPRSAERDVTGYNVYRSDADQKDWIRLNDQPLAAVTFHDDRVTVGRKYFYRVTAVDTFNNESAASGVVSETANP